MKYLWIGLLFLTIVMFVLGELFLAFGEEAPDVIRGNRNIILLILWLVPLGCAFVIAYKSPNLKLISGLSFAFITPAVGTLIHYIHANFSEKLDFHGIESIMPVFKIYFLYSIAMALVGAVLGYYFSRE